MLNKSKIILLIIITLLFIFNIFIPQSLAKQEELTDGTEPPDVSLSIDQQLGVSLDEFNPSTENSFEAVEIISKVLGTIRNVGIVLGVILIALMGIRYMVGSAEEKSEYKETFVTFTIGIFIFVGSTSVIALIYNTGINLLNNQ